MKPDGIVSSIVSSALGASILLALTFAVAPHLHERVHRDATATQHECAVTLIATGKYEHSDVPPLVIVPQPAAQFSKIPALNPIWVAAPFLGACVFEHAPPALS